MTEREFIENVRAICDASGASKVLLFGSRAHGTNRLTSDFDFAVYGASDIERIREEVDDLPTLYSADIIDMQTCTNYALIREIDDHGILV